MSVRPDERVCLPDPLVSPDRDSADDFRQELSFLGYLTSEERPCLPDWLVVAPPKTGTCWLHANLRNHPDVFVPKLKELKYFSHRFECDDLRTYLDHFRDGAGRSKGELSPSYSMLPRRTIRLIKKLMPDLKLIYLMRDPLERAWSHARHSFRYGEANFKGRYGSIDQVTDDEWMVNLSDDWNRLSNDYLGQLQRWLSVFPREKVFVGFFEDLAHAPRMFLRRVLEFLGVDSDFADSSEVTLDALNVGLRKEASPAVMQRLREMYLGRTAELVAYLDRELQLRVPIEWEQSFGTAIGVLQVGVPGNPEQNQPQAVATPVGRLAWEADDETLGRLLVRDDLLEMDFLGFNIARLGTRFLAFPASLGIERPDDFDSSWWQEQLAKGDCLVATNPYDLKSMILRQTLCHQAPSGSQLARLRRLELQMDCLSRRKPDKEEQFVEARQPARLFGAESVDALRRQQGQIEHRLARCVDQLSDVTSQLRATKRQMKKFRANRIIQALRWLDGRLPSRRRAAVIPQAGPQTVGCVIVRQESRCESEVARKKVVLPIVERSAISLADCPKPYA